MFGSIGAFISQIYETVKLETFRFVDWPSISFDQQRVERLKRQVDEYSYQSVALFPTVKTIIEQIKQKTEKANENNRSRTNAYLTFFSRHPEVHWALLAHIVSRNYGWRMTDLQGSLLHPFLSFEQKEAFYLFSSKPIRSSFRMPILSCCYLKKVLSMENRCFIYFHHLGSPVL